MEEPEVLRVLALTLDDKVSLGNGVGLRVDLLAVEVDGSHLVALTCQLFEAVLGDGEHAARAARPVVEDVGAGQELLHYGQEGQVGHQAHHVARGKVLACLLVVLLAEAPDQLLEDRTHPVVVEARKPYGAVAVQHGLRAQVDAAVQELLYQVTEGVRLDQGRYLVTELELVEDLLHVLREAVQVGFEVRPELLRPGPGAQVAQRERRGIVESLPGLPPERGFPADDTGLVEPPLPRQHLLLGRLQHGVQAADDGHRQDEVAVLAAHVHVAQYVVGDAPDEVGDPVELRSVQKNEPL